MLSVLFGLGCFSGLCGLGFLKWNGRYGMFQLTGCFGVFLLTSGYGYFKGLGYSMFHCEHISMLTKGLQIMRTLHFSSSEPWAQCELFDPLTSVVCQSIICFKQHLFLSYSVGFTKIRRNYHWSPSKLFIDFNSM